MHDISGQQRLSVFGADGDEDDGTSTGRSCRREMNGMPSPGFVHAAQAEEGCVGHQGIFCEFFETEGPALSVRGLCGGVVLTL